MKENMDQQGLRGVQEELGPHCGAHGDAELGEFTGGH